ncbi:MAG: hypothetical protein P4L31_07725 [Candidatus Babeliales bacterium]|nr:hypothetical protein [Candidatus Babeliales bacterium]
MKTDNILTIYEHLYKASDNLQGQTIEYITGFQNAVYLLQLALKNYEHINLHVENKRLKRQLLLTDMNFDDSMFTIVQLRQEKEANTKLIELHERQIVNLKKKIEQADIKKTVMGERINNVEIDFEGTALKFGINADQETFDFNFQDAVKYVYERRDRKTKRVSDHVIRNWFMQSFKDKGFKVVTI